MSQPRQAQPVMRAFPSYEDFLTIDGMAEATYDDYTDARADWRYAILEQIQKMVEQKRMSGDKPIVVCDGEQREAKDIDDAQRIAESLAHSKSADAYILKPVRKVSPKRDVVTTDLS